MSANSLRPVLCCLLLMLGACSNDDLPKWFTGEPSQAEINAYKGPVNMPGEVPKDAPFPNLADVPARPVPKMTAVDKQNEIAELQKENTEGQAAVAQFVEASKPVVKAKPVVEKKKTTKKKKKKAAAKKPIGKPAEKPADVFIPENGAAQ